MSSACFTHRTPTQIIDGCVAERAFTAKEHAEFATSAFQRAFAAAGTPVVRRLCLAVGNYQRRKAEQLGCEDVSYSADDLRRRPGLKEEAVRKRGQMEADAVDYVENAERTSFVMERWQHFPFGTKTNPPTRKLMVVAAGADPVYLSFLRCDALLGQLKFGITPERVGVPDGALVDGLFHATSGDKWTGKVPEYDWTRSMPYGIDNTGAATNLDAEAVDWYTRVTPLPPVGSIFR